MEERIREILINIKNDTTNILELTQYNIHDIINVALDNELYDSLLIIFSPISINGEVIIPFDAFSTNILSIFKNSYDNIDDAMMAAKKIYDEHQEYNKKVGEDDLFYNNSTYEEILSHLKVIPKEVKEKFRNKLFNIDFELISQIKIKNSHAREISGVNNPINSVNDVIIYSEPACLTSCIDLYNKNIQTTMNDTEGVIEDDTINSGICKISIKYDTLSQENQAIIDEMIKLGQALFVDGRDNEVSIFVPCSGEEKIGEVSNKLKVIISKLKMQDVLYGRQTLEEFWNDSLDYYIEYHRKTFDKYFSEPGYTWNDVIKFVEEFDYYYDDRENILWKTKELYRKHKVYLESQKEMKR